MKLYEYTPTRSVRVRWVINEVDAKIESVNSRDLIGSEELKKIHPMGKLPALQDGDRSLFESIAITNFIADKHSYGDLIPKAGTWERALHDQWSFFVVNEIEMYLWHTAQHTFKYPENERVPQVFTKNSEETAKGLKVIDEHLAKNNFMLGEQFSVTDIIVGYTLNWAGNMKMLSDFPNANRYLDDLHKRAECPLVKKD